MFVSGSVRPYAVPVIIKLCPPTDNVCSVKFPGKRKILEAYICDDVV